VRVNGQLKNLVQMHGDKNWGALAGASGRTGKWAEDVDIKLKDAVQTHGGKSWGAIAALIPDRTQKQCLSRWHDVLIPKSNMRGDFPVNGQQTKT
jgi:hypothetical protein